MSSFTASGARRTGDEYQDFQSAMLLVEWLEQPDSYRWVRLEAMDGSLDDIQAELSDGTRRLLQVKFATNSSNAWGWDELLKREPGAKGTLKPSLLQKWKTSLDDAQGSGVVVSEAALLTNRAADAALQSSLDQGLINFAEISPAVQATVATQLGGASEAAKFLRSFRFGFKDLSIEALEDAAKTRFLRLGGSVDGWSSLLKAVRRWINNKDQPPPDGTIRLDDVRVAALWHLPALIPQSFNVPPDYVPPISWSELVVGNRLRAGGVTVVTGSPGAGKSTYLSWLVERLRDSEIPVVRHHYFLSTSDTTPHRTSWETAADAIIGQLRVEYPRLVTATSRKNPQPESLREFLTAAGAERHGKAPLLVVIDGLDHVWRETGTEDGLQRLFDLLLPPPVGVAILVGTQNVDSGRLPAKLRAQAPVVDWLEIPILDGTRTTDWLGFHRDELGLPEEQGHAEVVFHEVAAAFFDVTRGHPLVLHYTLKLVRERTAEVRPSDVLSSPRFDPKSNIASYYRALWENITPEGHHLLHLLAGFHWTWPRNGLVQCLAPFENALDLEKAETAIRHVLGITPAGVTAFHESLLAFVRADPNHEVTAQSLRPRVTAWLTHSAPEYWKWRHEWEELARSGNPTPLIESATLDWCVRSLASGRSRTDIGSILAASGLSAVAAGRLAEATERQYLDSYLADAVHAENVFGSLAWVALRLREPRARQLELSLFVSQADRFFDEELEATAEIAFASGETGVCEDLLDELRSRWNAAIRRPPRGGDDFSSLVECVPFLVATTMKTPASGRYQTHLRNIGEEPYWCEAPRYARALARCCSLGSSTRAQREELRFLANRSDRPSSEAADEIVRLGCRTGFDPTEWIQDLDGQQSGLFRCYGAWLRNQGSAKRDASKRDMGVEFSFSSVSYPYYTQAEPLFVELSRAYFFVSLAAASAEHEPPTATGLYDGAEKVRAFLFRLRSIAVKAAASKLAGNSIGGAWLFDQLSDLEVPDIRPNDFANSLVEVRPVARILVAIAQDLEALHFAECGTPSLTAQAVAAALASRRTWPSTWINERVAQRATMHDAAAAEVLVAQERLRLETTRDSLHTRAADYAALAHFSELHRFAKNQVEEFTQLAARSLLGHGYHKDVVLFDVIAAVQASGLVASDVKVDHLRKLVPVIEVIPDITDGDETRHLKRKLGEAIWDIAPRLMPAYVRHLQHDDHHWDVEACMTNVAGTLPLTSDYERALAATLVHDEALDALKTRADDGNNEAATFWETMLTYLGRDRESVAAKNQKSPERAPADRQPTVRIEDYPPGNLIDFVRVVRDSNYFGDDVFAAWTEHWRKADPAGLLDALTAHRIARERPLETKTARIVTQLATELAGPGAEWDWLVAYHQAFYGWNSNLYSKKEVEWIWTAIRSRFRDRWLEFIYESARPQWRTIGGAPAWSVERLVRFLEVLGESKHVAGVLGVASDWASKLVANMQVPAVPLASDLESIPVALSLLLDRLDCPSRMVQERAGWGIAEFLARPEYREVTTHALLDWHARGALELRSCMLLLVLNLARVAKNLSPAICVEIAASANVVPSVGASLLLRELGDKGVALANSLPFRDRHAGSPPSFKVRKEFAKIVGAHLAPLFTRWSRALDESGLPFSQQWEWEAERLAQQQGRPLSAMEDFSYHYRSTSERPILAINDRVSMALRSAYLRGLHFAFDGDLLDIGTAESHGRRAGILADPGLWAITPSPRPSWWPHDPGQSDAEALDLFRDAAEQAVRECLERTGSEDEMLLLAAGPIGHRSHLYANLEVRAFLQSAHGPQKPSGEDLDELLRIPCTPAPPRTSILGVGYSALTEASARLDDWLVAPLAWSLHADTDLWLIPERQRRGTYLPASWLFPTSASVVSAGGELRIAIGDESAARFRYWHDTLRERYYSNTLGRVGTELLIRRKWLAPQIEAGATLCWFITLRVSKRGQYEDEFEESAKGWSWIIGGSRMVWPEPWHPPRTGP